MEPRTPTTLSYAPRWNVLATGAALGTLLVLAAPPAKADPAPPNPHAVTKCIVEGITTYSDKRCPDGSGERHIAVDNRLRWSPPLRKPAHLPRCAAPAAMPPRRNWHNIDTLTRQGQPRDSRPSGCRRSKSATSSSAIAARR